MSARDTAEFLALAAIWGASFLFMRIAVPEFGPLSLMLVRCAIGAATLLPILLWHGRGRELADNAGRLLVVGTLNSAIPFVLLGVASLALTAGVTSILNSLAPLWAALIAWLWLGDRLTRTQALGLGLGAVGVAILVGGGGGTETAGTGASALSGVAAGGVGVVGPGGAGGTNGAAGVSGAASVAAEGALGAVLLPFAAGVLATAFYGVGANFARRFLGGVHPLATATGSQLAATLVLLVPGILFWPDGTDGAAVPSLGSWLAAIALGVVCTGIAYLLFFRLIASVGATRTIAVTFVIPLFGVGWGALLLGERIDPGTVVGGAIIVLGTALTTGVLRLRAARASTDGT